MSIAMETYILNLVVKEGGTVTESILDTTKMIGNITFAWLVLFAYTSYMLLGIWYHSEKDETSLDLEPVKKFFVRAKEVSLVNIYVIIAAVTAVSLPYIINGRKDVIPFLATFIGFAFISFSIVSHRCVKLIAKEIDKRVLDSNKDKKDSEIVNEETESNQSV